VARQRPGIAKRDRTRGDPVTEQSSGFGSGILARRGRSAAATVAESLESIISGASSLPGTSLREAERRHIESALAATNWVIEGEKGAARILDVHPNTLRRMKKLNIQRPGEAPTNGEPTYGDKSPFLEETGSGL
jgi:transcriptional regulator with GAF, ATPase, and Fis domain